MILANMQDAERYYSLHPLLKELFEYVRTHDLSQVPAGRVTLKGDELFINVTDATLLPRDERKMEVHRAYMDVHIPLLRRRVRLAPHRQSPCLRCSL